MGESNVEQSSGQEGIGLRKSKARSPKFKPTKAKYLSTEVTKYRISMFRYFGISDLRFRACFVFWHLFGLWVLDFELLRSDPALPESENQPLAAGYLSSELKKDG